MDREKVDAYINEAAYQYFRDVADGDYIMARSAFFSLLAPQFFHYAQQALEKYMKCIHVLHRDDTKNLGHDLAKSLKKLDSCGGVSLSKSTADFICEISMVNVKYLQTSYTIFGAECVFLDKAVWELRRYCIDKASLDDKNIIFLNLDMNDPDIVANVISNNITGSDFTLPRGKLEKILADKEHPAKAQLIDNNPFYGTARNKKVFGMPLCAENTLLHVFNNENLYEELKKYIVMPAKETFFTAKKIDNIVASQSIEFRKREDVAEKSSKMRNKLAKNMLEDQSNHVPSVGGA